ncbi:MAG: hypothetical protein AAFR76_13805, partial [Planctomycetota bacterium]
GNITRERDPDGAVVLDRELNVGIRRLNQPTDAAPQIDLPAGNNSGRVDVQFLTGWCSLESDSIFTGAQSAVRALAIERRKALGVLYTSTTSGLDDAFQRLLESDGLSK